MNIFSVLEQTNIKKELDFLLCSRDIIDVSRLSAQQIKDELIKYGIDVLSLEKTNNTIKIYIANNIWELSYAS